MSNPAPTILVIFGASGDLTARKLAPAIFNLSKDNLLPQNCFLIGVGRTPMEDLAFREYLKSSLDKYSRRKIEQEEWQKLESQIFFHTGAYDDLKSFAGLEEKILNLEKNLGKQAQCLFYISTPPNVFEPILDNLGESGLASRHHGTMFASKVIIEKPFGKDLESARKLNDVINQRFDESQVFRIDHYLGKETVQSLLVQRFSNSIFEPSTTDPLPKFLNTLACRSTSPLSSSTSRKPKPFVVSNHLTVPCNLTLKLILLIYWY